MTDDVLRERILREGYREQKRLIRQRPDRRHIYESPEFWIDVACRVLEEKQKKDKKITYELCESMIDWEGDYHRLKSKLRILQDEIKKEMFFICKTIERIQPQVKGVVCMHEVEEVFGRLDKIDVCLRVFEEEQTDRLGDMAKSKTRMISVGELRVLLDKIKEELFDKARGGPHDKDIYFDAGLDTAVDVVEEEFARLLGGVEEEKEK